MLITANYETQPLTFNPYEERERIFINNWPTPSKINASKKNWLLPNLPTRNGNLPSCSPVRRMN